MALESSNAEARLRRGPSRVYTEAEWKTMRPFIGDAYARGLTQKELIQELARRGFPVTLSQLKKRVHDWGLQRRISKKEYITILRQRRHSAQPHTVEMRGRIVGEHKIERAMRRFAAEVQLWNGEMTDSDSLGSTSTGGSPVASPDSGRSNLSTRSDTPRTVLSDVVGHHVPAPMLGSEHTLTFMEPREAEEVYRGLPEPYVKRLDAAEQLSSIGGVIDQREAENRRLQSMQLLSGAFHDTFVVADRNSQLAVCTRMWKLAIKCYNDCLPKEAEIMQFVVVDWLPRIVENNNPWLVSSVELLTSALAQQAKYTDAERFLEQQLQRSLTIHGACHAATLSSRNDIATLLMHTGQLDRALDHAQTAYDGQLELLGETHLDTLYTRMTIGGICLRDREYAKAEQLLQKVARQFERQLGEDAVFTFRAQQELARCAFESGQLERAKSLYTESVNKQKEAFGSEHHETVSGMVRLARVLIAKEEYVQAKKLLQFAVDVFMKRYGEADPVTLRARLELAAAYEGQHNLAAALEVQQIVLTANAGRLQKCPFILKGLAQSAWRLHYFAGKIADAIEVQHLVIATSRFQGEPPENLLAHCQNLEVMQEAVGLRSSVEGS